MRVLITNIRLDGRTGTELYVRDLCSELRRRDHHVAVYTQMPGVVADELRAMGVPVFEHPDKMPFAPDIIHGHHLPTTAIALVRHPNTPAVFFCHDATAWYDKPLSHPRVCRYIAVDEACRDRFHEAGIHSVETVLNSVNLRRFRPRSALPARPSKALIFSNAASEANYPRDSDRSHAHRSKVSRVQPANAVAILQPSVPRPAWPKVFTARTAALARSVRARTRSSRYDSTFSPEPRVPRSYPNPIAEQPDGPHQDSLGRGHKQVGQTRKASKSPAPHAFHPSQRGRWPQPKGWQSRSHLPSGTSNGRWMDYRMVSPPVVGGSPTRPTRSDRRSPLRGADGRVTKCTLLPVPAFLALLFLCSRFKKSLRGASKALISGLARPTADNRK